MKLIFTLALLLGSQSFALADEVTPAIENRAVEIKFYGGMTGFDSAAYRVVKSALASFIVDGTADHFITTAVGFEGGSTMCIELNQDPTFTVDPILNALKAIQPGHNSYYQFIAVPHCVKPE